MVIEMMFQVAVIMGNLMTRFPFGRQAPFCSFCLYWTLWPLALPFSYNRILRGHERMKRVRHIIMALVCASPLVMSGPISAQIPVPSPRANADRTAVETVEPTTPIARAILDSLPSDLDPGLAKFYRSRGYAPIWFSASGASENAFFVLEAFSAANIHALNPDNYEPLRFLERAQAAKSVEDWAAIDIDLSIQFLRYATHLSSGRVQPNKVNKALNIFPDRPKADELFANAEATGDFSAFLEGLAPQSPNYLRLQIRMGEYREKAANGGFTPVPDGPVLKPGMSDPRVTALRKRLIEEDSLISEMHAGSTYDGALVDAVKEFQSYHGLETDGVVGAGTLGELNVPINDRLIQMELNMERRRWMPDDLGSTYVFVNLADQALKVVRNERTVHTAPVIVGKPYHATPVFSDQMTYVEVNPYWNIPRSIATAEYLPKLQQNASALSGKGIRVLRGDNEISPSSINWSAYSRGTFPFQLRQDPGEGNALGRIKFMFPNKFNIYIHDTPGKSLFQRTQRDFSHGCIRVSDPFALGDVLLSSQGYDRAKLESIRDSEQRTVISLKAPIKVHLTYLTAWMNKDGSTHFRKDIYGRDATLLKALRTAMTENL